MRGGRRWANRRVCICQPEFLGSLLDFVMAEFPF